MSTSCTDCTISFARRCWVLCESQPQALVLEMKPFSTPTLSIYLRVCPTMVVAGKHCCITFPTKNRPALPNPLFNDNTSHSTIPQTT